jgi:hypothetical protein
VVPVGNWSESDALTDIAISAPSQKVMGQYGSGQLQVFDQSQLANTGVAIQDIIGVPSSEANFGVKSIPILSDESSIHNAFDEPSYLIVSAPAHAASGSSWQQHSRSD